jgi:hypothetical protein
MDPPSVGSGRLNGPLSVLVRSSRAPVRSLARTTSLEKGLTAGATGAEKLGELPGCSLDVAQLIREPAARQSSSTPRALIDYDGANPRLLRAGKSVQRETDPSREPA